MDQHRWVCVTAVLGCATVSALGDESPPATVQGAPGDDAELRAYVKRLEDRVTELERDRGDDLRRSLDGLQQSSGSALADAVKSIEFSGFVEMLYSHNLRPGGAVPGRRGDTIGFNQFRGPDADADTFSFQTVQIRAERALGDVGSTGFKVRADYGRLAEIADADPVFDGGTASNAFDVREAYFVWRAPFAPLDHVDFMAGKFRSLCGFETLENDENWLVTRNPIAVFGTPATHTGIGATAPLGEKVTAMVHLVNGWDDVTDANDSKTAMAHLTFGRFEDPLESQFSVRASYGGTTGGRQGDHQRFLEFVWDGKLAEETEAGFDVIDGESDGRSWRGAALYVRQSLGEKTKLAARVGRYSDDALGPQRVRLCDVSLALWHELATGVTAGVEFRHDWSGDDVFLDGDGDPIGSQDTLTLSLLYRF